jgi:hypothetical protein
MSRPRLLSLLTTLALMGNIASAAWGQSNDEAECRAAAAQFMVAFDAGDAEAVDRLTYREPGEAQPAGVKAMIGCLVAQRAFEAAVAQKWGPDAARTAIDPTRFTAADHAAVPLARFDQRGPTDAILVTGRNVAPIVLKRARTGAPWQVVLHGIASLYDRPRGNGIERGSRLRIEQQNAVAIILHNVAGRIRSGEFAAADQAVDYLQKLLERAASPPDT